MKNFTLILNRFGVKAIAFGFILDTILFSLPGLTDQHHKLTTTKTNPSTSTINSKKKQKQGVDFSGMGRPGQQTAGESRGNCPQVKTPLTALIPISNSGRTIAQRPNFWVYVPYDSHQIKSGEFVLQDENRQDIYRTQVNLKNTPDYINQSLPTTAPALEVGKWYVWYFKLYCDPSHSSSPLFVQGWIQRVAINSAMQQDLVQNSHQLKQVYVKYNLWYDAINSLNRSYFTDPSNSLWENNWLRTLQAEAVQLELPTLKPIVQTMNNKRI